MKSLILKLLLGAALMGVVSACNTFAGIGEDISAAGRGLTRGAEQTKQKM
ncbi:MAG TPA: entericidin A/B family lipoprotein [Alphaproteobacteria bacterium]|jgi:predicted small secreted protein